MIISNLLHSCRGSDNVIGIDLCLRQDDAVVFIMPYLSHKRFSVSCYSYVNTVILMTVRVLYASVCMGYTFVSSTPEDVANVDAGVWRLCKGN